jgi:hypothetical protein
VETVVYVKMMTVLLSLNVPRALKWFVSLRFSLELLLIWKFELEINYLLKIYQHTIFHFPH